MNHPKKTATALSPRLLVAIIVLVVLLSATLAGALPAGAAGVRSGEGKAGDSRPVRLPSYVPGQVLVSFKRSLPVSRRAQVARAVGAGRTIRRIGADTKKDTYLYRIEPSRTMAQVLSGLRRDENVVAAGPNYIRKTSFTPNDPALPNQWGLRNTGQLIEGSAGISDADIDAPEAWDIETGDSTTVTVAVIDSGVDHAHPDLSGKMWSAGDTPGDRSDDDENGYIDDTLGYNFAGISQYWANIAWQLGSANSYPVAQSIKGTGEPLTHVGIMLAKQGAPSANIVIKVRSSLSGGDLATATITPSEVTSSYREVYKELSAPVTLANGTPYYLVIQTTGFNSSKYYLIADNSTAGPQYIENPYRDGQEYWWTGSSWTSLYADDDLYFRTNANANPRDDNGHGTHVAGIVGASTNNSVGVAGTAPGARIMALKAGDCSGFLTSADIIEALHYAADNGADVVNMSFASTIPSSAEQDALNYAAGKGVTLLAAAGNDSSSAINYPAGYTNVIGVGATTNRDQRASFSNYNATVDVSAPGQSIFSTLPTYLVGLNSYGFTQDYDYLSGTSMATPVAAGVAALVIAENYGISPQGVQQALESTAQDLGALGRDDAFGYGRVNAAAAVGRPPTTTVASAPTSANGDNGWFKTVPAISLSADESATTYYSWNSSDPPDFNVYDSALTPAEGTQTLYYYSEDASGHVESVKSKVFKVDIGIPSDPDAVISTSHVTGSASSTRTVEIQFSGATDTFSGVGGYATSWTENTTGTPVPPATLIHTGTTQTVASPPLADGEWYFNLSTKDVAGNWTSTVHLGPFSISGPATTALTTDPPEANSSGWFRTLPQITLTPDESAAVHYKWDPAGIWQGDEQADASVSLPGLQGQHTLYYYSVDADDTTEPTRSLEFKVDTVSPTGAGMSAPALSTAASKTAGFNISWSGTDAAPSSGKVYDVWYKIGVRGVWKLWRNHVTATSATFTGRAGNTYYFRSRTFDNAGNGSAYSAIKKTIVPYDDRYRSTKAGFAYLYNSAASNNYLGTLTYSTRAGESISYRLSGNTFSLIVQKGPKNSRARVYVDGVYTKTIDTYSATTKYRQVAYTISFRSVGAHTIKVENQATAGRPRLYVDGVAAGR